MARSTPSTSDRNRDRYGRASFRRPALVPGILAGVAMLAGTVGIDGDIFLVFRFIAAIFALIIGWFALQARQWWWLPPLAAIAVLWNPVWPFPFDGQLWVGAQYLAAIVFFVIAWLLKVPVSDEDHRR